MQYLGLGREQQDNVMRTHDHPVTLVSPKSHNSKLGWRRMRAAFTSCKTRDVFYCAHTGFKTRTVKHADLCDLGPDMWVCVWHH